MFSRLLAIITLVAFVLLSALLQSTTPSTIHPVGILCVFVLFYVWALGVLTFFVFAANKLALRFAGRRKAVQPFRRLTLQGSYYYASVLALAPVLFVGMNSIGRGSVWDIILIVVFEVVACFYITKRQ